MRLLLKFALWAFAISFISACTTVDDVKKNETTNEYSYVLGSFLGYELKTVLDTYEDFGVSLDQDTILMAIDDVFRNESLITDRQAWDEIDRLSKMLEDGNLNSDNKYIDENNATAYAVGAYFAPYMQLTAIEIKKSGLELNEQVILQGTSEVIFNSSPLTEQQATAKMQELEYKVLEGNQNKASQYKAQGETYRAEFEKQDGVQKTESGLLYKVEREGSGAHPRVEDVVVVHYEGKFIDGTQFDSTYDKAPATFSLDQVIYGWEEALQLMNVGSKYTIVIPPELAYGDNEAGPIPANSTLIFSVELLAIK